MFAIVNLVMCLGIKGSDVLTTAETSTKCILGDGSLETCDDSTFCVGSEDSAYVYAFAGEGKEKTGGRRILSGITRIQLGSRETGGKTEHLSRWMKGSLGEWASNRKGKYYILSFAKNKIISAKSSHASECQVIW